MQKSTSHLPPARRFDKKLILVIKQDHTLGTQLVQKIRQGKAFQAILATSLAEAHAVLSFLKCDFLLLADDTFPEEDLERLYLLPAHVEPPAVLDLSSVLVCA
jgi:hypothetical protein